MTSTNDDHCSPQTPSSLSPSPSMCFLQLSFLLLSPPGPLSRMLGAFCRHQWATCVSMGPCMFRSRAKDVVSVVLAPLAFAPRSQLCTERNCNKVKTIIPAVSKSACDHVRARSGWAADLGNHTAHSSFAIPLHPRCRRRRLLPPPFPPPPPPPPRRLRVAKSPALFSSL